VLCVAGLVTAAGKGKPAGADDFHATAAERDSLAREGRRQLSGRYTSEDERKNAVVSGSFALMLSGLPWKEDPPSRRKVLPEYYEGFDALRNYIAEVDPTMMDPELVSWLFWPGWIDQVGMSGSPLAVDAPVELVEAAEWTLEQTSSPLMRIHASVAAANLSIATDWVRACRNAQRAIDALHEWQPETRRDRRDTIAKLEHMKQRFAQALQQLETAIERAPRAASVKCEELDERMIVSLIEREAPTNAHANATAGSVLSSTPGLRWVRCRELPGDRIDLVFRYQFWGTVALDEAREWVGESPWDSLSTSELSNTSMPNR
jgi:hypothetical protein